MSYLLSGAGPYTLTKTWYIDGTATDVGTVTVGVVDGNGATVVAAGTATTNNGDGTYTYSLASQSTPQILTVTWTRSDTGASLSDRVEAIGSLLFTEAEARAFDNNLGGSQANYSDSQIAALHMQIADDLETWTGQSWISRYARVEAGGSGSSHLWLNQGIARASDGGRAGGSGFGYNPTQVISADDGSIISPSNIVLERSALVRTDSVWTTCTSTDPLNVTVQYVYGHRQPIDGVDRIALMLLRDRITPDATDFGGRATSFSGELGTWRFETPGRFGNVSTIPEVNAWVKQHSTKVPFA